MKAPAQMNLREWMRHFFGIDVVNMAPTAAERAERRAAKAKERTELLAARGLCIQGPLPNDLLTAPERSSSRVPHGPVVPGSKHCERCLCVKWGGLPSIAPHGAGTPAMAARGDETQATEVVVALSPPVVGASLPRDAADEPRSRRAGGGGNGRSPFAEEAMLAAFAVLRDARDDESLLGQPLYHERKAAVFEALADIGLLSDRERARARWVAASARQLAEALRVQQSAAARAEHSVGGAA